MSLKTAAVIEDLYTSLCAKGPKAGKYKFFKYSDIDHYDIIDILNAFKILTAYKIFRSKTPNEIQEIKEYVDLAGGLLVVFPLHFGPDEIAEKISLLDKNDKLSFSDFWKFKNEIPENKDWAKSETLSSFTNYLLGLERNDENFWEKVFNSIGISWDKRDSDDEITFIINNKNIFFRKEEQKEEVKEDLISTDSKNQYKSIYLQHKYFFDQAITNVLLGLSIFFPIVRVLVFSIIALLLGLKIYFGMQKPIKQKFVFFTSIINFCLFTGGIFLSSLTLYAIGFAIFTTIVDIIRGAHKDYNSL